MLWKGNVLGRREEFADAMVALQDPQDAGQFRAIFAHVFPDHTDELLANIAVDRKKDEFDRVVDLLDIDLQVVLKAYRDTHSSQCIQALAASVLRD